MMHEIKIVIADAGQTAAYADDIIGGIPQYYAAKYRNIKVKQEACQELTAGFLLKSYLGIYDDGQIIRNEYGKPMLRSGEVHFNLSHLSLIHISSAWAVPHSCTRSIIRRRMD